MANKKKLVGPTDERKSLIGPSEVRSNTREEKSETLVGAARQVLEASLRKAKIEAHNASLPPGVLRKLTPEDLEEIATEDLDEEFFIERELFRLVGPPNVFRLQRDADRDLQFTGWHIGQGERRYSGDRTVLDIYFTASEKFVVHVLRFRRDHLVSASAGVVSVTLKLEIEGDSSRVIVDGVERVLLWMKSDAHGTLGPASKCAWEAACRKLPWIAEYEVEEI